MKIKNIIIICIISLSAFSCIDEIAPLNKDGVSIPKNVDEVKWDNETIYRNQTDKNRMINSLILYDKTERKYVLDITEHDALRIGITLEMYKNTQKYVDQLNEINKEHL